MELKSTWTKAVAALDKTSKREKLIILSAIVITLGMVWQVQFMDPLVAKHGQYKKDTLSEVQLAVDAETSLIIIKAEYAFDPNRKSNDVLGGLVKKSSLADQKLDLATASLIDPQSMVKVLRDLLEQQQSLTLLQFETTQAEPITEMKRVVHDSRNDATDKSLKETGLAITEYVKEETGLYRHGISLLIEGDFQSVVAYLKAVELMDWNIYWKAIEYQVKRYPVATVNLRLETLSTEREWIGV